MSLSPHGESGLKLYLLYIKGLRAIYLSTFCVKNTSMIYYNHSEEQKRKSDPQNWKGGTEMPMAQENLDIKKAMAYDLLIILQANEGKTYTAEEVVKIIQAYIAGLAQK